MLLIETEKFSAAVFMPKTPPEYSVWTVLPQGDGEALFALLPEPKPALICISADWNRDLSPWTAPAVFGDEDFGDGAEALLEEILPLCAEQDKDYIIGGYARCTRLRFLCYFERWQQ